MCRFCFVAHQWARKSHALQLNAHQRIYWYWYGRTRWTAVKWPKNVCICSLFVCSYVIWYTYRYINININWFGMGMYAAVHVCIWPIMWQLGLRICLSLCLTTKINVWQTNQFMSILIFIDLIESNSRHVLSNFI